MNQIVEHHRNAIGARLTGEALAVLKDHHAGRLAAVVLRRHIDPVFSFGARIDLARFPLVLGDFALGYASLPLRVGTEDVIVDGNRRAGGEKAKNQNPTVTRHESVPSGGCAGSPLVVDSYVSDLSRLLQAVRVKLIVTSCRDTSLGDDETGDVRGLLTLVSNICNIRRRIALG